MLKNRLLSTLFLFIAAATGYAISRWTTPTKIEIKKEIVTVEKKVVDTKELNRIEMERNKKLRTIIVEITRPDGTKEKTTRHIEVTRTSKTSDQEKNVKEETEKLVKNTETKLVENKKAGVVVGGLAGVDVSSLSSASKPIYGAFIHKSIIGPIGAGIFGLTNGTAGVSLGLSF